MSDGFAYLDILFFAMVAAFVAFRLRGVLGRKTGNERRRPTPVATPPRPAEAARGAEPAPINRADPVAAPGTSPDEAAAVVDASDAALKSGLTQVRLADPGFELGAFLEGAKAAFAITVEAYAKGDKAALRPLLAEDVFASFAAAIDERERAGQSLATELVAIDRAALAGAAMAGTAARLTVRFQTRQINVTKNAAGEVAEGDPSAILEVVDLWTFERDTRSRDPNWALVETRTPDA